LRDITVEEEHDVVFIETKGSQHDNVNLDDMRGTQLINVMKNMDISYIQPERLLMFKMTKIKCYPLQLCKSMQMKLVQVVLVTKSKLNKSAKSTSD